MLDRLDYLEYKADIILSEMSAIESRVSIILSFNDVLNAAIALDAELYPSISSVQDELEAEFRSLCVEFDALESQLNELGDEYDALVFVASLALPA